MFYVLSVLVSSALVGNAAKAHAETTTNVEKTATDESEATSSSKTVTAESGIVIDKANNTAEGDTSTSEQSATTPTSTKDTKEAKDDQSSTTSANDESSSTTESTATTNSAAEGENEVAGDATSKEESTESAAQATASEVKSDSSTQEDQTSSQSSSKDDSVIESNSSANDTSVASSLATSFALPLSNKEKMELAIKDLIDDVPTETETAVPTETPTVQHSEKWGNLISRAGNILPDNTKPNDNTMPGSNYQKAVVIFWDDRVGKELDRRELVGLSNSKSGYTTAKDLAFFFIAHRTFNVISDETNGQEVVFDDDTSKDQVYTVHLLNWSDGIKKKKVNRTIIYRMSDGSTAPKSVEDSLEYVRELMGRWEDFSSSMDYAVEADIVFDPIQDFKDVVSPTVEGYVADREVVSNKNIDYDHDDITEIVTYTPVAQPVAQKAIIKYVDVSSGTPVELSKDTITGKSNSWEVYTGGNEEVILDGNPVGTGNLNSYRIYNRINKYLEQGYALVENNIPSSSLENGRLLFDNDSSVDQEYTVSFINTNNQYNLNLAYYDVVTGQTVATKSVKTNEQIDFPVPDGYTLAAPGQPIAKGDSWTFYPGITMPKIIGKDELEYFVTNVAENKPIVVPVYKTNGVTITRTINLHKPNGTVETVKQPVVFKNSVKSTPINPSEDAVLGLDWMVMPISEQDKTYTFDTWLFGTHSGLFDHMPILNLFDTSTWSATDVENFPSKYTPAHGGYNGISDKFYTQYEIKVSGYKADGTDTWESYTTPTIAGYKATLDYVDPVKVKVTDSDVTVDIYYTTDTQNASVTYIDDSTGKELTSDALKGNSGAKSGYTTADKIKSYQDLGYVLVSDDTNGQEVVFDNDASADQKYTVHLKHGTVLNSLTDTVNRTINYKMSDGSKAPDSVHDALTYTANTLVDKVTGEILSTEWSPAQDFKDVASPEVAHYVPDRAVVSNKGIGHDHADIVEEVTYTPKNEAQKAKVSYVDETTGKTLKADELNGTSNAKSGYTTAKSIEDYQNLGYVLVSDETSGNEVVFDDDTSKDQEYKVVLKHGYATVTGDNPGKPGEAINKDPNGAKWPDGTDKANLSEDVHRVITYRMSDSSKAPDQVENILHFTAKKVVDKVTGEVVSTEWSAPQDFEDVASPAVKGYVADKAVVSNKGIAHDAADIHEIVTYTPADQKATVTYVDSLTGKTIMTKELVGKSNAASGYKTEADIKSLVDKGYVFESDETNGKEVVFDDNATVDQNYVVKLTHKFETSEETHQATRKIRLHEPDDLKVITQIGTVKRSVKIDSVTGEKTYGDWTQDKWTEFDTPALDGYTASLDKVEEKAVGGDTKDEVVDIYYNKPEEPAPAPEEPTKPAEPAPEKKETPAPAKPAEPTVVTTTQAQLPQTGNKDDKMVKTSGVLAAGASLMTTLFSSFKKKSK